MKPYKTFSCLLNLLKKYPGEQESLMYHLAGINKERIRDPGHLQYSVPAEPSRPSGFGTFSTAWGHRSKY